MADRTALIPCGTLAAARRHRRRGEVLDSQCRDAENEYARAKRVASRVARQPIACLNCGSSFVPQRSDNRGFCSSNCSSAHGQRARRVSLSGPIVARPCVYCAEPFTPKNRNAMVCSKRCRNAYRALRDKGMSADEFRWRVGIQMGVCDICGKPPVSIARSDLSRGGWHIDHDHETGEVRGLLCANCNLMLGHAKDDPNVLWNAIGYLVRVGRKRPPRHQLA